MENVDKQHLIINIPLVELDEFLQHSSLIEIINKDKINYISHPNIILNSFTSLDWILDKEEFSSFVGYILYLKNENKSLNPNILRLLDAFSIFMERIAQRIKNDHLNTKVLESIRRCIALASWILILLLKKYLKDGSKEKISNRFFQELTLIFRKTITYSLTILINSIGTVDCDQTVDEILDLIIYQNNILLDIFSNCFELKELCYPISQYIHSLSSLELFREETQRFLKSIISLSFHHNYINDMINELLKRLAQKGRNTGYLLFGAVILSLSRQYINSNDIKASLKLIKLIHDSDLTLTNPSERLILIFINYILTLIIRGDNSYFRSIISYILTHVKYAYENSFTLGDKIIQFILTAVNVKDVTIKLRCLECLELLIIDRNADTTEFRERILDIIVECLTKYSTKVRSMALKILYSITCSLNSELWFIHHLKERTMLENIILNIAFLPTTSPYYRIDIFERAKNNIHELLKYKVIDISNILNMVFTRPIESHISDMIVEIFNSYLQLNEMNIELESFWCDIIRDLTVSQMNILSPLLCKIEHSSLDISRFIDIIRSGSKNMVQALKLCYCLFERQRNNINNELGLFIKLIHNNLHDFEILDVILDILLRIDPSYLKSSSLIEMHINKDLLEHLFLSDSTRKRILRLLYLSLSRPRRTVFGLVENILNNIEKYGFLKLLRILQDVTVENCIHLKLKVKDYLNNEDQTNIKESITRIQDNDILSGYISRFINMLIYGLTSLDISNIQKMYFLFCCGTLLSYSPTLAAKYSDLIISNLSRDNIDINVYCASLIIGTDLLRTIPNQVREIKDYLFDFLKMDNTLEHFKYVKYVSLNIIEQLFKARLINIDYKINYIASMLIYESETYNLRDIAINILENYIQRSSSKLSVIRLVYNLCMSILTSDHLEEEKNKNIIKVLLSYVIKMDTQKELSTYIMKGLILDLNKGRFDNLLRYKAFLLSVCKKSKRSVSLVENVMKDIENNHFNVDEDVLKMLKLHMK